MSVEGIALGPDGSDPELAELARLADDLVVQIRAARRQYEDLRTTLENEEPPTANGRVHAPIDEAHLAALSMALTGSDRDAARTHLCGTLGIDEPDADTIVDEAFGVRFDDAALAQPRQRRFARAIRETA
jgi:hypothetical protein